MRSLISARISVAVEVAARAASIDVPSEQFAVRVGRGDLHQRCVERHAPGREQRGDVGQEDRHEVGSTLGDRVAQAGRREQRYRTNALGLLAGRERQRSAEMQVPQFDVLEIAPAHQRVEQRRRRRACAVDERGRSCRQARDHVVGGDRAFAPRRRDRHDATFA
jgi:hypothetical protein